MNALLQEINIIINVFTLILGYVVCISFNMSIIEVYSRN